MTNTESSTPMSIRFKEGHADLHERAEMAVVPTAMAGGTLDRDTYIRLITTEYPVHAALDERLQAACKDSAVLAELVDDRTFLAPAYRADLEFFGIDPDTVSPSPAALEMIELIHDTERTDPLLLLAFHYVRFGASNGNRYVAKKLRPVLGLESVDRAPGSLHLDPYGSEQRALWDAFKQRLDAQPLTDTQRDQLVASARSVFHATMAIHREVAQAPEVTSPSA